MQFSLSISLALAGSLLSSFTSAQTIDPKSVDKSTRQYWCQSQQTQCPLLCLQLPGQSAGTRQNSCDPDSLSYACVCSNGQTPNVTEFSQTIPYFLCTESNNQCVKACGNDNTACQSNCRASRPCGATDPKRVNTTASATMSATGTAATGPGGSAVYTGLGGSAPSATSGSNGGSTRPNAGNAMVDLGQSYGLAVMVAGFFGGLALVI